MYGCLLFFLVGDVLVAIDGILIKNSKHAGELMNSVKPEAKSSSFTVIQDGTEKIINVVF